MPSTITFTSIYAPFSSSAEFLFHGGGPGTMEFKLLPDFTGEFKLGSDLHLMLQFDGSAIMKDLMSAGLQ
jgi:hypothetical protein